MLEVYPNPASDKIQLNYFTSEAGAVSINVVDVTGKVYITKTATAVNGNNTFTIGLDALESGVYFVQIKNGEKQVIDKFIVTK
ncbi:MAG: T9SS type A sorting domain-containing protein [Bacteroidetes bacterium]|nr:T9SS type A sorting domain-containing protein [Bacteroidota bacterium]